MSDLKSKLLADRIRDNVSRVDIPGVGVVVIRTLSRAEFLSASKLDDTMAQERRILSLAMVEPALTEAEVGQWQASSPPGEINAIAMAVNTLSGIGPGAEKEQYKSVRDVS
jgi:hypothetical protein